MAERVGASGRVTGLDNDGRVGHQAVRVLRAAVAGQFEFIQADAETTGEPPGGPFDLVYARLLLFHLRDPVAMLRKMYAWTRPGGVLLVQDWDCRTMDIVPLLATWAEFERVMYGVFDIDTAPVDNHDPVCSSPLGGRKVYRIMKTGKKGISAPGTALYLNHADVITDNLK